MKKMGIFCTLVLVVVLSGYAQADPWINSVVLFDQPSGSSTSHNDPNDALEANDGAYVSIDIPETLILAFTDNTAMDGDGDDLFIYEIGGDNSYIDIFGSQDGINWVFLVNGAGSLNIDLQGTGLFYVNFLKFVGIDNLGTYPGYDLDAVEALNTGEHIGTDVNPYPGDFDGDGDVDALDLYFFTKVYGEANYPDELITVLNIPVLAQGNYQLSGGGSIGCVATSFGMLFSGYFNKYNIPNQYSVEFDEAIIEDLIIDIAIYLEADVDDQGTWVKPQTLYDKMNNYLMTIDVDPEDGFLEGIDWTIDFLSFNEKNNDEWISYFKEVLANNLPILVTGYSNSPVGDGGHAQIITGYQNIGGSEYLKIHDTNNAIPRWWKIMKNKSLTWNGQTDDNLLRIHRYDNSGNLYQFYLNGRICKPLAAVIYQIVIP